MANQDPDSIPVRPGLLLSAILLLASSLALTGAGIIRNNQSIQVPLVHWINDHSLYPGDPFALTLPRYASLVWWIVAWLSRAVQLEPLLFLLLVVQRLALLLAAGRLGKALAPGSVLAAVASMTLLALGADVQRPGNGTLVSDYFEQTGLSIACFLFCAASIWTRRRWPAALWFAAGFTSNSLYGIFAVTFLVPMATIRVGARQTVSRAALPCLFTALLCLPGLLFSMNVLDWSNTPHDAWVESAQVWLHDHLFPALWNKSTLLRAGVALGVVLIAARAVRRTRPDLARLAITWSVTACLWLIFAVLAGFIESPPLLLLQPGRAVDLWFGLCGVLLCSLLSIEADGEARIERRMLGAAALCGGLAVWQHVFASYIVGAAVVSLVLVPLWSRLLGPPRSARFAWSLIALTALLAGKVIVPGIVQGDVFDRLVLRPPGTERLVAEWAASRTSIASTFLVPPEWEEFRALSRRPVFLVWKDVSAILWAPSYVNVWRERTEILGVRVSPGRQSVREARDLLTAAFEGLQDDDVVLLGERYGVAYWVIPADHPSSLPEVARAGDVRIVEVRPADRHARAW